MKKIIGIAFFLLASIALVGCVGDTTAADVEFTSDNQVFVLEALGASTLLEESAVSTVSMDLAKTATTTEEETDPVIANDLDNIDMYLSLMEQYLGNENLLGVSVSDSDNPDYTSMIVFTTVDLLGEPKTLTLYYNEIIYDDTTDDTTTDTTETTTTTTEEVTTESDSTVQTSGEMEQDRDYYFEDTQDDDYVTYYITGVLIDGDVSYEVEGKLIQEDTTSVFRLRAYVDHDNFVKVEYKTDEEDSERKFFYEVVKDGQIQSLSKVKIEEGEDSFNLILEIIEGTSSLKLHIVEDVDGDITIFNIRYEYKEDGEPIESGHIRIEKWLDETTQEYVYDYKVLADSKNHTYEYSHRQGVERGTPSQFSR